METSRRAGPTHAKLLVPMDRLFVKLARCKAGEPRRPTPAPVATGRRPFTASTFEKYLYSQCRIFQTRQNKYYVTTIHNTHNTARILRHQRGLWDWHSIFICQFRPRSILRTHWWDFKDYLNEFLRKKIGLLIWVFTTEFVTDFFYQHRVAFDGATSEVEVLDTCGCTVNIIFICFKCWHSFVFMAR